MQVKILALKTNNSGQWIYQVQDSDGKPVKEKDKEEAEWILEDKLST